MGSLIFEVVEGSGRAECRLCHKIIGMGVPQLRVTGRAQQGSIHYRGCPE